MSNNEYYEITLTEVNMGVFREKLPDIITDETKVILLPSTLGVFYAGTLDVLDFFQSHGISTEVCSSDSDYKEIAQYSRSHWIGTFLISSVTIPIFVNLLSSYIYDKAKAKEEDTVVFDVIVEHADFSSTTVRYRGKVEKLPEVLKSVKELQNAKSN